MAKSRVRAASRGPNSSSFFSLVPLPARSLRRMELRGRAPCAARSWLVLFLALLVIVPAAEAQGSFAFLQPLSNPVQCQPYAFAWTGGTPAYSLQVSVNNNWNKAYGISGLEGPGFPWTIPVPAGYAVSFELFDNASHVTSAGPLTIQPSEDTSCFSEVGNGSSNPSSTSTSSTIASSTTTTSSTTTSSTTTSSTTTSSSIEPPTTPSTTSTTSTSSPPSTSSFSPSSSLPSLTPFTVSGSGSPSSTQPPPATPVIETTIVATPSTSPSPSPSTATPPPPPPRRAALSTGAAAGIAVAGTAALVLAGAGAVWFCRRRRRRATPGSGSGFGVGAGTDMSTEPDLDAPSGPQMSEAQAARRLGPLPAASSPSSPSPYSPPSSSGRGSDPFASDRDGSRQLLLHTVEDSEDSALPLTVSASARRRRRGGAGGAELLSSSPGVSTDDSILKPPGGAHRAPSETPHVHAIEIKPDSLPSARDLPMPPPPPTHPSRAIAQSYAAVPTHERSGVDATAHAHMMRFEEDGGVRLAGGLPGEVLDVDEAGSGPGGWVVQPPPYQRFR